MRTKLCLTAWGILALACTKSAENSGAGMAVDTVAARAGIDSLRASYSRAEMAGDAAALGQLYTEDATLDMYGAPRTKGRTGIEAGLAADFAARKYPVSEITPIAVNVRANDAGSEIGTYHVMHDVNGAMDHEWGRYVAGFEKGADGKWRLDYLMFFPDSTKAEKK
jgi:uncharacterized protein (TIGR02246 family)